MRKQIEFRVGQVQQVQSRQLRRLFPGTFTFSPRLSWVGRITAYRATFSVQVTQKRSAE